jgi:excisionase family DNA binding protein
VSGSPESPPGASDCKTVDSVAFHSRTAGAGVQPESPETLPVGTKRAHEREQSLTFPAGRPTRSTATLLALRGGADNLLTVREAAARLHVSTATVYALAERGELPHVRISNAIRVLPADLAAYLARQRKGGR